MEYSSTEGGAWQPFSSGFSVGAKRIDVRAQGAVRAQKLRFSVTQGFGKPAGLALFAFAPAPCATAAFEYATA